MMDSDEVINKAFSDFTSLIINSISENLNPDIQQHFPKWPEDAPPKMVYKPNSQSTSNAEKSSRTKKKTKKEVVNEVKVFSSQKKRGSRYNGNYDDESLEKRGEMKFKNLSVSSSAPASQLLTKEKHQNGKVDTTCKPLKKKMPNELTHKPKKNDKKERSLSDTSSSSSEDEMPVNKANPNGHGMLKKENILSAKASNFNEGEKLRKEFASKPFSVSDLNEYLARKAELDKRKAPPPVIPAPSIDPLMRRKKKKAPENQLPEAHLGGIFTINNGWDKPIQKKEQPKMVPRDQRCLPKINIVRQQSISFDDQEVQPNGLGIVPYRRNDSQTDDDDNVQKARKASENSSFEKDSDEDKEGEIKENIQKDRKATEQSSIDKDSDEEKESENKENVESSEVNGYLSDNEIELFADGELDDFLDKDDLKEAPTVQKVEEPMYVTELEDTCLKIYKQAPIPQEEEKVPIIIKPQEPVFAVDPETDEIIKRVFGGACPGFLANRCEAQQLTTKCQRHHMLLSKQNLYNRIAKLSDEDLEKSNAVLVEFHRLFKEYVEEFTYVYAKRKNEQAIIKLITQCESHGRLIGCYRSIHAGINNSKYLTPIGALEFIIANHNHEYVPSRDVIINMIAETGPNMAKFQNYIGFVMQKRGLPLASFKKIFNGCMEYQVQTFPNLCLNYLMTLKVNELEVLGKPDLSAFLKEQGNFVRCYNQMKTEAKLVELIKRVKEIEPAVEQKQNLAVPIPYQNF